MCLNFRFSVQIRDRYIFRGKLFSNVFQVLGRFKRKNTFFSHNGNYLGYGNLVWDWSITQVLVLTLQKQPWNWNRHKNVFYHVFTTRMGDVKRRLSSFQTFKEKPFFSQNGENLSYGKMVWNWSATEVLLWWFEGEKAEKCSEKTETSVLGIPFGPGIWEFHQFPQPRPGGPQPRFYLSTDS